MRIRAYRQSDRAALEQCLIALQEFERSIEPRRAEGEAIAARYVDEMLASCEHECGRVLVAEVDGAVVGYVTVNAKVRADDLEEIDYEYAYIKDIFVLEAHRGRGLGRALLTEAETFAHTQGAEWLRIGVLAWNASALGLYKQMGFDPHEVLLEKSL